MKAHTPVYRPILKHALKTAWTHRELWPIAAVAGLAGTGAVVNDVINQAKLAASLPTGTLNQALDDLQILGVYRDNLILANPEQITVGVIILLFFAGLAMLAIAACQQVMLRSAHRAAAKKTRLTFKELSRELLHPRLLRFLTLDLFLKLLIINLMVATTTLVGYLQINAVVADAVFGIIFSAAAFALALSINVVVMLALVGVARKDLGIAASLGYAWQLYRRHPLICLEMSILLFATNFLISAVYDGTILVLGVPAVLSFASALQTGSVLAYLGLTAVAALVIVTVTLAFLGFATTFTYCAWTALAEHLDKRALVPRVVVHSKRFLEHIRT